MVKSLNNQDYEKLERRIHAAALNCAHLAIEPLRRNIDSLRNGVFGRPEERRIQIRFDYQYN
jgi:hypothetical protein